MRYVPGYILQITIIQGSEQVVVTSPSPDGAENQPATPPRAMEPQPVKPLPVRSQQIGEAEVECHMASYTRVDSVVAGG